jgi:hypothetical protein
MNRLDKPFKAGDKVVINQHGQDIYGHDGKLLAGRLGYVREIPQERWHNNEIVVEFVDEPGAWHMGGCWAYDLARYQS